VGKIEIFLRVAKNQMIKGSVFKEVYEIVRQIPRGKVFTYGAISQMLDKRLTAQGIGWALNALTDAAEAKTSGIAHHSGNVPWHRVINARGAVSTSKRPDMPEDLQRVLLEAEGIEFSDDGLVDLETFLWSGQSESRGAEKKRIRRQK
jgi:methylated-DNA-protein-cysteine methyltransferase-like protein